MKTLKGFKEEILCQMFKLPMKVMVPFTVTKYLLQTAVILPLTHLITAWNRLGIFPVLAWIYFSILKK